MPLGVVSAVIGVSRQLWELPGGTAARWVGLDGLQSQGKRPGRDRAQETQKGEGRGMSQAEGRGERECPLVKTDVLKPVQGTLALSTAAYEVGGVQRRLP